MYVIEQAGVIYYAGLSEPGAEDLEIISQWLKLPVVQLFYDGPVQYRDFLERKLNELGVLIGVGDALRIVIKTSHDLAHYEICYREFHKTGMVEISKLNDQLSAILSELFPNLEKPSTGFLVEVSEHINVKKVFTNKPVEFKYQERIYSVTVKGQKMLLVEGFYDFFGKTVYVDRDMNIDEPVFFVEGADMVYKVRDNFAVYRDGKLSFANGRSFYINEPFDIVNEMVLDKLITAKIDGSPITVPAVGRYEQYLLLANGVIVPLDLSWAMKICGSVVDWTVNKEKLYVLDISSYLRAVDLKNRKILWEKRLPGAWGIGSYADSIYVGVDNRLFSLDENGKVVSIEDCYDFGIWKEGIITLKSPQEGHIIRSQIGFAILKEGKAVVYVDEPRSFENVTRIKFFDWGVVVVTPTGCWVVER